MANYMTYNQCSIYRGFAKRFRKQITNGFSKAQAGVYYRNGLLHSCQNQCEDYTVSKKQDGIPRDFICPVCRGRFPFLEKLRNHQIYEHQEICKFRNRKW